MLPRAASHTIRSCHHRMAWFLEAPGHILPRLYQRSHQHASILWLCTVDGDVRVPFSKKGVQSVRAREP